MDCHDRLHIERRKKQSRLRPYLTFKIIFNLTHNDFLVSVILVALMFQTSQVSSFILTFRSIFQSFILTQVRKELCQKTSRDSKAQLFPRECEHILRRNSSKFDIVLTASQGECLSRSS